MNLDSCISNPRVSRFFIYPLFMNTNKYDNELGLGQTCTNTSTYCSLHSKAIGALPHTEDMEHSIKCALAFSFVSASVPWGLRQEITPKLQKPVLTCKHKQGGGSTLLEAFLKWTHSSAVDQLASLGESPNLSCNDEHRRLSKLSVTNMTWGLIRLLVMPPVSLHSESTSFTLSLHSITLIWV